MPVSEQTFDTKLRSIGPLGDLSAPDSQSHCSRPDAQGPQTYNAWHACSRRMVDLLRAR